MTSPRRVLFLSSCVRGGGAGWSLYYLLKHLDREHIDPLVVVPDQGIFAERFAALDVRVEVARWLPHRLLEQRFATQNLVTHWASAALNAGRMGVFVPKLARLLERERIELVHCNNMMVKPLGASAAQLARRPCILHVRNIHERAVPRKFYGAVARLPSVRRIIANSAASARPYLAAAPDKVVVVHNGIDLEEYGAGVVRGSFRASADLADRTVIGFTGNLIPRKGIDTLLRAAAKIVPERPRLSIAILGRVPLGSVHDHEAEYRALAAELGIAHAVHFVGFVPDVRAAVADFDVLALPSRQEPFGRSIIEAMAMGTPVVATNVGGIPEIIESGEHGLLVPPDDPDALAGALAAVVDDAALRRRLSAAARARVAESFDVAKLTRRVQDEILGVLARRSAA